MLIGKYDPELAMKAVDQANDGDMIVSILQMLAVLPSEERLEVLHCVVADCIVKSTPDPREQLLAVDKFRKALKPWVQIGSLLNRVTGAKN